MCCSMVFLFSVLPGFACRSGDQFRAVCPQISTVWSLVAGAPLTPDRGEECPEIVETASSGTRRTVDGMSG